MQRPWEGNRAKNMDMGEDQQQQQGTSKSRDANNITDASTNWDACNSKDASNFLMFLATAKTPAMVGNQAAAQKQKGRQPQHGHMQQQGHKEHQWHQKAHGP